MRFSNSIAAIAILAGPLRLVFGAQTIEQITLNLHDAENDVTDANDDAQNVNAVNGALDYTTVVNNNKNIASSIEADDGELEGTPVLSPDQQQELVEAAAPFLDEVQTYYDTLTGKADDFPLPSQRSAVQESVDSLQEAIDNFLRDLETLAPNFVGPLEDYLDDTDVARENLDDKYEADVV